jgi:hypothetical protein
MSLDQAGEQVLVEQRHQGVTILLGERGEDPVAGETAVGRQDAKVRVPLQKVTGSRDRDHDIGAHPLVRPAPNVLGDGFGPRSLRRSPLNLRQHHHYICVRCGLVRDFESAKINALRIPKAAKRLGSVSSRHIEVPRVCVTCMKRARKGSHPDSPSREGGKGAKRNPP